jgi:hypothetical protein
MRPLGPRYPDPRTGAGSGDGGIVGAFAPDRGALVNGVVVPTPWRGAFGDYRQHDGVWLPFFGEVSRERPEGRFTYWQGQIAAWERSAHA